MLVPPLLTALTAAVGVWWKGRQDRRDRDKERHRVLTQVRDEVQVIQSWITAYNTVCADPEAQEEAQMQARKDLDRAYSRLGESLAASRGVHEQMTLRQIAVTMLLLNRLHTGVGTTIRAVYYASLAWALLWTASGTSSTPGQLTFGNVVVAIAMIVILVFFLHWACTFLLFVSTIAALSRPLNRHLPGASLLNPVPDLPRSS
jgi:hypothetical protein